MVQEKEIDKILKSLINELKNNHGCHTIILYGSHARGDATEKSDFDILGIKDKGEFYRIGRDCCGVFLDAFIYSVGNLPASSDLLRVHSGKILLDENGIGERLLKTINEEFEKPVQKLPDWEKELRKTWVKKMYERSLVGDIEGNHRRHWLLFDLLDMSPRVVEKKMSELKENGKFELSKLELESFKNNFDAGSLNQDETVKLIKDIYNKSHQIIDPHTAIAVGVHYKNSYKNSIVLSTAHAAKFPELCRFVLPECLRLTVFLPILR